jgi:nitrate/TMAO reductase-like tetraheme cytochrome c subunit
VLRLKESLLGVLAIALVSVSVVGCVQFGATPDGYESDDDCQFCHTNTNTKRAKNISRIYANEAGHHPVDIEYPPTNNRADEFNLPNARDGKIIFFDNNGNRKLDHDEIRLYPDKAIAELTCASCHREHSKSTVAGEHPDDDYLRGTNLDGELCVTCHRKQMKPMLHQ